MKFKQWIDAQGGVQKLAKRLGLSAAAVYSWTYRRTQPQASDLQRLVRMSNGKLSYDVIINQTKKRK